MMPEATSAAAAATFACATWPDLTIASHYKAHRTFVIDSPAGVTPYISGYRNVSASALLVATRSQIYYQPINQFICWIQVTKRPRHTCRFSIISISTRHTCIRLTSLHAQCQWLYITRKLCYRKDDRAMRPTYRCHENFRDCLTTPTAAIPNIFMGFCSDRLYECSYKMWSP